MDYNCNLCEYTTNDKFNFARHKNSKRHRLNMGLSVEYMENNDEKLFPCIYCAKQYSTINNLMKHKKICEERSILEKNHRDEIEKYKNELKHLRELYDKDLLHYTKMHENDLEKINIIKEDNDKIVNSLSAEVKHLKLLIDNAGSIIKNSMSALSYAMKHYKDAPVLETINDYSALKYNQNDTEFIENLLIEYKNKLLPVYLGNFIIKTYKKDDPSKQSIWNSDTNRLTYVIKEILNNNKTDWQIDKKGIKTTKYIILPVMDHIEELLRSYIEGFDMTYNLYAPNEAERKMLKLKYSTDILQSIENKVLHDEVLKYIASHFFMNKNSIE